MSIITQGKNNWKFILIVVVLAIFAGVEILINVSSYNSDLIFLSFFNEGKKPEKNIDNKIACTQEAKICPDGSSVGRTGLNCEFAECPAVKTDGTTNLIQESFSYPYPVEYRYNHTATHFFDYSLTGLSLGKRTVPSFVYTSNYKPGNEIYALTLYLKIKNIGRYGAGVCLDNTFRLLTNEEGDLLAPVNARFNADCLYDDQTYFNQEVIFVVPESQKIFNITTGGESNIFFTVTVSSEGHLKVEKAYTGGQG